MRLRRTHGIARLPWWLPAVGFVAVGAAVGSYGFTLGTTWRSILSAHPLDPIPADGLLVSAIAGGSACIIGLVVMVSRRGPVGPGLFAIGVGLICGVMLGFVTGPG